MDVSVRIINLRELNDMTQKDLAEKTNINKSVMNRIESGERALRDDEIVRIAKVLGVSTDYLLGKSEIKNPYHNNERIQDVLKHDSELVEFWEELKEREDLQLLFKQTKNLGSKEIKQVMRIIKAIENEENGE